MNRATTVSAITESMVSNTVQSGITAFEKRRKIADGRFAAQMAKLVLEVSDIQHQVSEMAGQIQHTVIKKLTAGDGVISKLIVRQDDKIDEMKLVMFKMAALIKDLLQRDNARDLPPTVINQARSPHEREITPKAAAANGCPLPDRSKQRLNYGAPTEGGTGAHDK
jgi:hypothetical protein